MPLTYLGAGFQPAEHLLPVARAAAEAGFDGIALPDHVANPVKVDTDYPGTEDGHVPWKLDETSWPDPFVAFAAIAAQTELRMMTHVFILPLRSPVLVAKTVGTFAAIFPNRFEFGVGVGWMPDEFELTHTEFRNRGRRTDEAIGAIRALWESQPASFEGEHYRFTDIEMHPAPSVPAPILVGGHSKAAIERAARLGDGFVAMPATIEEYGETVLPPMYEALERQGRSRDGFHINVIPSDVDSPEKLDRLDELGVTSVQLHPFDRDTAVSGSLEAKLDAIASYGERMLAPRRSAA